MFENRGRGAMEPKVHLSRAPARILLWIVVSEKRDTEKSGKEGQIYFLGAHQNPNGSWVCA